MTKPTSAASTNSRTSTPFRRLASGFTLVEMLVVLGIIVLLMGMLAPMVNRAYRNGERTKAAADLQTIATALEAYKQDHGAYPPVRFQAGIQTGDTNRPNPPTGAQVLCQALVGPAPATEVSPPNNFRAKQDGAPGYGFKTSRGLGIQPGPDNAMNTADDTPNGRVWGPYIQVERFKIAEPDRINDPTPVVQPLLATIVDRYRKPILYFPASAANPNIRATGGVPGFVHSDGPTVTASEAAMYDADDNLTYFTRPSGTANEAGGDDLRRIRLMLGESLATLNGRIDGSEQPATTGTFLLWSAGPDELFGPNKDETEPTASFDERDVRKCDDVTNFR